jgi:PST family polysaccharide transporter
MNDGSVKDLDVPSAAVSAAQGDHTHSPQVGHSSYGQIFKSTAFTGGSSVINIALGIVRTKVMAVLLGPSGIGLIGLYLTITGFVSTIAGMGIGKAGVRQIAEAAGSRDEKRVARTIKTLRRTALILGASGTLLLVALSWPVSVLTFGSSAKAWGIAMLGLSVFLIEVSAGQAALIQGLRRIADLARLNILGALTGTLIGLPLVWFWRERAIVPLLILLPAASLLFSWWFARRVIVVPLHVTWKESANEARTLLGFGLAFMVSGLVTASVAYLTRLLILRQLGLAAVGHYTAAYTLAGIYAGFILQAMGTDFYPRLTAVADDHPTVNRLVNEQMEIALLMAVPGILGTLTFAPWVIRAFYAGGFNPAVVVLEWQVLGVLGQVISFPMGYILLAKGLGKMFVLSETFAGAVQLMLLWGCLPVCGISAAGIAFFGTYVCYIAFLLVVLWRNTRFRWSSVIMRLLSWMLPAVVLVFVAVRSLPPAWSMPIGLVATLLASWVCVKGLVRRVPEHRLARLGFLARWFR